MKKLFTIMLALAACTSSVAHAQCEPVVPPPYACSPDFIGGCGYKGCRQSPYTAPIATLATFVVVAVIAVAVQSSSKSGHVHGHSHN